VVAEVPIDGRWVIVDPSFRVMLRDAGGKLLTRKELQNPAIFAQATGVVPNYPKEYDYAHFAHIRIARCHGWIHLRNLLDTVNPGWEESLTGACCWNANPSLPWWWPQSACCSFWR